MFPPSNTARVAPRLVGALRLIRSFLLLEDDYVHDWEVGQDEQRRGAGGPFGGDPDGPWHAADREPAPVEAHPHPHSRRARVPQRERRPGAIAAREQVCACPLPPLPARRESGEPSAPAQRSRAVTGQGTSKRS